VLGKVTVVVFAPEDLALVKGDPRERRRFLDQLTIQRSPRIAAIIADLDKLLRQRSALLKRLAAKRRGGVKVDTSLLDVFDDQFVTLAAQLTAARIKTLALLRPHLVEAYHTVASGQSDAAVVVKSGITGGELDAHHEAEFHDEHIVASRMREALAAAREKELDRAITLIGPQRDDYIFTLGSLPARGYASHGESWSLALALRLASFQLLAAQADASGRGTPILILDDVFAELDATRRNRLAEIVAAAEQVCITAAVPTDVPAQLETTWFHVEDAQVIPIASPHEHQDDDDKSR
ncbi:MAG: DNA replication and repair protein RecF, partial [Bowdeniella nasicola]|nr:DNA replication and repair protein RecF [Bowdeniella nasicola]